MLAEHALYQLSYDPLISGGKNTKLSDISNIC